MVMSRKFKPGDWVNLKGKPFGPQMKVVKYVPKDSLFGIINDDTYLECVRLQNGIRYKEIFNQNKLLKSKESRGLYKV